MYDTLSSIGVLASTIEASYYILKTHTDYWGIMVSEAMSHPWTLIKSLHWFTLDLGRKCPPPYERIYL